MSSDLVSKLSKKQQELLLEATATLDSNFCPPLLWGCPKLSSWYAVGLLARQNPGDVAVANRILANVVATQWLGPPAVIHGTFPRHYRELKPQTDGSYDPTIYGSFDPNNALFVTLAGIIIDSCFSSLLEPKVHQSLRRAMTIAVEGDLTRKGGVDEDNLYPCYSNAWYMRCVCCSYVGWMNNDEQVSKQANEWTDETVELFNLYGTLSEYNSPTYAGITFLTLGLAQFLPPSSRFGQEAPRLIAGLWKEIGETYNPSLRTTAGPWDRTYGHDMTRYCSILGFLIGALDIGQEPYPHPLNASEHVEDAACIPLLMLVVPAIIAKIPQTVLLQLSSITKPRSYTTRAFSPPHDKRARLYTFFLDKGLSVGGIKFDEVPVGGPNINPEQFSPGVLMWDAGLQSKELGCVSYYPTENNCSIIADANALDICYPDAERTRDRTIQLNIWLPSGHYLNKASIADNEIELPGLKLSLCGNVATFGSRTLKSGIKLHGLPCYRLILDAPKGESAVLRIAWQRTAPPKEYLPHW